MTPEEAQAAIDHLAAYPMAWQASAGLNRHTNRRGDCTMFRATRAQGTPRLYGWGALGQLNSLTFAFPPALASNDVYDEAFPHVFHNIGLSFSLSEQNALASVQHTHVPNTEEFFDNSAVHDPLQEIVSIAALRVRVSNAQPNAVLACTAEGALYATGEANRIIAANSSSPSFHEFGLGPGPLPFTVSLTSHFQTALQRVYGDDDSFTAVRFVKVQCAPQAFFALDDQGYLWMSGSVADFAVAADFPENSTLLKYFRKRVIAEYYDKTATLITDSLLFVDFWVGSRSLLALTADGRMFGLGNNFAFGKRLNTRVFHEVGGFVDTVTVTNEGNYFSGASGSASFSAVTFSPPSDPYGERATGFALIEGSGSSSKLKGIVIINPGWGYTTAPTITFSRGSGSPPADFEEGEAECTIYTGGWKHASIARGRDSTASPALFYYDHYVAVSEDGVVYSWGAVNDFSRNVRFSSLFRVVPGPRRMLGVISLTNLNGVPQPAVYEKVFAGRFGNQGTRNFGVALDVDGKVSFWGNPDSSVPNASLCITPTLDQSADALTLLSDVNADFGAHSFVDAACSEQAVALVRDDHVVFTYGAIGQTGTTVSDTFTHAPALGQGKDTYNNDGVGVGGQLRKMRPILGTAKFTRVFAFSASDHIETSRQSGFYAVREPEELDPMYGTRISSLPPYQNPLTATRGPCSEVFLEWEVGEPYSTNLVSGFRVEYRLIGVTAWTTFSTVGPTVRSATITGLGRVGYQFRVSARDSNDEDLFAFAAGNAFSLGPPTDLTFTRDPCDQVQLSWTPPVQAECVVVANYRLEYRAGISGTFLSFGTVAGTETTGTVTGLDPTLRYQFRVARVADAGPDLFSNTVTSGSVPATPTGVAAALGTDPGEVDVTWNAVESQLCFPNTDYRVQFRPSTTSTWSTFARAPSTDKFATVTGLTAGVTYFFRVRATNTVGNSSDSTQSNSVTV
jgi:alpha-tubulin suppressor-like RCC1 family protein